MYTTVTSIDIDYCTIHIIGDESNTNMYTDWERETAIEWSTVRDMRAAVLCIGPECSTGYGAQYKI